MAQTGHMLLYGWMVPCPMCPCPARDTLVLWQMACPAPSVASTTITATWGLDGMPRRAKWGAQGSAVHLSRATTLKCCCCEWTCLGPATNRVGPWQCPAWECDNHHSGSHYHTGATCLFTCHCWTSSWHCCDHQPAAPVGLGTAAVGFPCHLNPCLLAQYAKEGATISGLGAPWPSEVTEDPFRLNEEDPAIPALMASPTQVSPWAVMPEDIPSTAHVSHSPSPPTMLKSLEVASTFPIPQPQAPQGWSSWTARWGALVARANECGPRVATCNQGHDGLPSKKNWSLMPNSLCTWMRPRLLRLSRRLRWALQLRSRRLRCTVQPGSKRPRCAMLPIPVSCNKPRGKVC